MERDGGPEATGIGGGGVQRFAAGVVAGVWSGARRGLCAAAEMEEKGKEAFLSGSGGAVRKEMVENPDLLAPLGLKPSWQAFGAAADG